MIRIFPASRRTLDNAALCLAVIFCWSSSWYASKLQGHVVSPFVSLVWRFSIATPLMFGWSVMSRQPLRFGWRMHSIFLLTGVLMFSCNFAFAYHAVLLIPSGMVSVIFSFSTVFNMGLAAVIFRQRLRSVPLIGAACGLAGLLLLFLGDFRSVADTSGYWAGALSGLAMTVSFSLGNMGAAWANRRGVPAISAAAWSMMYGLAWSACLALASGATFGMEVSLPYLGSLIFLSIFGTLFAFGAYLKLLRNVGPANASYCMVWLPIGALMISSVFEQFRWTSSAGIAVLMISFGNILVLLPRSDAPRGQTNMPA